MMNNTINEIKNSLEGINTRITEAEECINDLEDKIVERDFPGGAVVGNPPANVGDVGSSPGPRGSHMLWSNWACAPLLLSPCTTTESSPRSPQWREPVQSNEDLTQPKINK